MSSTKDSILFTPFKLGNVTLRNRTVRSAAFESMCDGNRPTQKLRDYHLSVARGGIGMTTIAYASVTRSGLSFDKQLWLRPEIVPELRSLTDDIHREGAAVSVQIGHCGNMTHIKTAGQIPISASGGFNLYSPTIVRGMKIREIEEVAKAFGTAVHTAHESGFDAVEVHAGHGYLISQYLSPYTNRRRDEFGGSLSNRMRFMRMCLENVMEAAAKTGTAVLVKTNMRDGFKGGMEIDEALEVAREIERFGVNAIVLSGGFVSKAPMYVMRGSMPLKSMTHYMHPWWLKYGVKACGGMMIKNEPYRECYFLEDALKFREALKLPLVYVGGVSCRESMERVLDSGFELVQMARALVVEPDFVNRMAREGMECRSLCEHKNYCIARMYSVDMQCHKHTPDLPESLARELENIGR